MSLAGGGEELAFREGNGPKQSVALVMVRGCLAITRPPQPRGLHLSFISIWQSLRIDTFEPKHVTTGGTQTMCVYRHSYPRSFKHCGQSVCVH